MIAFQLLLLVLLALPISLSFFPLVGVALAYVVVVLASVWYVLSLSGVVKPQALLLFGLFAILSLSLSVGLLAGLSVFVLAGVAVVALTVFFGFLGWHFRTMRCTVIGFTNGFAVVQVPKQLVAFVPAGVYAVACAKKPRGKTVGVRFSWTTREGALV